MALDTYPELVKSIADWMARGDLEDRIPDFIRLIEVELARDLKIREQEKELPGTLIPGQDYVRLPEDCLYPRHLRIESVPLRVVPVVSIDQLTVLRQLHTGETFPVACSQVADRIVFAPVPSSADPYTLFYHAGLPGLSKEVPTNQVLRMAPDCYLWGALFHAAPFVGEDERTALWGMKYAAAKESFKRLEWRARSGAGPLRMRPDFQTDDGHNIGGR